MTGKSQLAESNDAVDTRKPAAGAAPLKIDYVQLMKGDKGSGAGSAAAGDSVGTDAGSKGDASTKSDIAISKGLRSSKADGTDESLLVFKPLYAEDKRPAKYPQTPEQFVADLTRERPATPLLQFPPKESDRKTSLPDHTADFASLKLADWAKDPKAPAGDRDQLAQLIPNAMKDPRFTSEQRLNLMEGLQSLSSPLKGGDGVERPAVIKPEQEAKILMESLKADLDKAKIGLNSDRSEIKNSLNGDFQVAAMARLMELRKDNPNLRLDGDISKCADQVSAKGSNREAKEAAGAAKKELEAKVVQEPPRVPETAEKPKPSTTENDKPADGKPPAKPVVNPAHLFEPPANQDATGEGKPELPKPEKLEKPADKPLSPFQKDIANSGAYTLDRIGEAYNDAGKNGKGVALMIVGENTRGSKELLARLPELQKANPNMNFVVVDKDQVNKSSDPAMAPWKDWVKANQKGCHGEPLNEAFTSLQALKVDKNGVASPERVTSTFWGGNIGAGLHDQARFAASGTAKNRDAVATSEVKPAEVKPVESQLKPTTTEVRPQSSAFEPPAEGEQKPKPKPEAYRSPEQNAAIPIHNEAEFKKLVLEAGGPVLVDFGARWCGPCQGMAPTVDSLAKEFSGKAAVYKVDIDDNSSWAGKYAAAYPTFQVFNNGQITDTMVGAQSRQTLENKLRNRR